jgi:hypothetical protein
MNEIFMASSSDEDQTNIKRILWLIKFA